MGIILCKEHGPSGFLDVCEHIFRDLSLEIYPEMISIPILSTKICKECDQLLDTSNIKDYTWDELLELPDKEIDRIESIISKKYNLIPNRRQICIECVKMIQLNQASKSGKTDPFEAFENTLTYKERDTINELEKTLINSYKFKKSQEENFKTLYVTTGTISKPLTIEIYYVTEPSDQEKILRTINSFFDSIDLKQRVIRFYKEENFTLNRTENSYSISKGNEIIIREDIV